MLAGMELFRATALESRSGTSPGRASEAMSMTDVTRILLVLVSQVWRRIGSEPAGEIPSGGSMVKQ
jgi:hypothetical protein